MCLTHRFFGLFAYSLAMTGAVVSGSVHAQSQSRTGHADYSLGLTRSMLSGDLKSEPATSFGMELSSLFYERDGGLASGFYFRDFRSAMSLRDQPPFGFRGEAGADAALFAMRTMGVQLGWRLASETEVTFGLGVMKIIAEQNGTKQTFGADDLTLHLSQCIWKHGVVSLSASKTLDIDERYQDKNVSFRVSSFALSLGYRMRGD